MPGVFVLLSSRFISAWFLYGRREDRSWCCSRPHSRTPWEYCRQRGAERGQILGPRHLVPTALYRALSSVRHCVHVAEINLGSGVALGGSFSILDQRCAEIVVLLVIIAGLNLGPPLTKEGTPCLGQQNPPATNQSPR